MNDKERIRDFKIFRDFTLEDLESILQFARQIDYEAGDVILGDSVSESRYDLFIVTKGLVKVEIDLIQSETPQKSSKRLAVLKHGAVLGEIGLLRGVGARDVGSHRVPQPRRRHSTRPLRNPC